MVDIDLGVFCKYLMKEFLSDIWTQIDLNIAQNKIFVHLFKGVNAVKKLKMICHKVISVLERLFLIIMLMQKNNILKSM